MNKTGHVAFGVALASLAVWATKPLFTSLDWKDIGVILGVAAVASLGPDIDHEQSTASKIVTPFSARTRQRLKLLASLCSVIGVFLWLITLVYAKVNHLEVFRQISHSIPVSLANSYPLWLIASLCLFLLSRIRDLILIAVGAGVLYAYGLYHLHWFVAFVGGSLLILPLVKHRGLIHTPEFAAALTMGIMSVTNDKTWYIQSIVQGFILGWWAHLAGDLFGSEGIRSIFSRWIPWLRLAFHLFKNGGKAEKSVIVMSWGASFAVWGALLLHKPFPLHWVTHALQQVTQ